MKNLRFSIVAVAAITALCNANARELTPQNKSELDNVPPTWTAGTICYREGGGIGGPRVVVGIDEGDYHIRSERQSTGLPGYIENKSGGVLEAQEIIVPTTLPHWGVGYEDSQSVFVLPNSVRLTCDALPARAAQQSRTTATPVAS